MEKEIENSLTFWNQAYKDQKEEAIEDLSLPKEMEPVFNSFLKGASSLIDYGCGEATLLIKAIKRSSIKEAYGIESGDYIVDYDKREVRKNSCQETVKILDGGLKALAGFKNESADRIIISNVLDVVTKDKADSIIEGLLRVLKKEGLILLKLNPEFSKEDLLKMGFINFKDNLYSKNGIMRCRNVSTEDWNKYLKESFDILDFTLVPYQGPSFFDRLFLLRKK